MPVKVHPTAVIHKASQLGNNVKIGPFSIVEEDVIIGDDTEITSHVLIASGTRLGKNCRVFQGAVLGTIPQDLKFGMEKTTLEVGDDTTIREYATLNRGTSGHGKTVVGSHCLIMAYVHIAHDSSTNSEPNPTRRPSAPITAAPPQSGCAGVVNSASSSRYSQ